MANEHHPSSQRIAISTALATVLGAIVLLTLLGRKPIADWDEGVYAGISRAMLSGPWLIPHWNTQPWFEKPPLELWLTALSFKLFGVSEFTARLISAISGIALVGLIHTWLAVRRNALTAWLSTMILVATFGFLRAARVGEMDVLLSLGCTLALIGLAELARDAAPPSNRGWYVFFAGFAIALMTKGAASVTLPLTLVSLFALQPALLRRLRLDFLLSLALFLAAVLPWHLYMLHRLGNLFLANYLGLHVFARATSQIEGHSTPWWYYVRVLLLCAAPFVLLYPVAVVEAFHKPSLRGLRVFGLFALITMMLFSIVQTRLPHYIVPVYPALSILTASWLADRRRSATRGVTAKFAGATAALYLVSAWITAGPRKALHSPHPPGIVIPDNREQVDLVRGAFRDPQIQSIPGPLLSWRMGTYNPIPATVFYANRQVQQVILGSLAVSRDKYTYDPISLTMAVTPRPTLMVLDRALLPQLPEGLAFHPIARSTNLALGTLTANSRGYP